MQEQPVQQPPFTTPPPPKSSKKWIVLFAFVGFALIAIVAVVLLSQKNKPQPERRSSPPRLVSISPTQSPTPTIPQPPQAKQTTWKLNNPANHIFVATDNSFRFSYPADFVYETIDGNIPQQQHIVQFGRQRSQQEREQLAEQAGIPLTDTLAGISYTNAVVTLYYTNAFSAQKPEDLATGTILSKKQLTISGTPAIEATVDCPTECVALLFVKDQRAFSFLLAKPLGSEAPLDTTPLTQIESSFVFLQ